MNFKVPLARPYFPDMKDILDDIKSVLESGRLVLGPYTKEFEDKFAKMVGVKHAVAVSSCTAALQITIQHYAGSGEVIIPINTFVASANAVRFAGLRLVFAGMDLDTLNIDFEDAKKKVNKNTKAIMPVHLNGLPCNNIDEMREYCKSKDIVLIEDCAHSHGASIKGKKTGSFGDAGCFSFYATKVMTSGTGGMITTDDEELAAYARSVRHHGIGKGLEDIVRLGNKWLMPEINAVIGLHQLKKLDNFIRARNKIGDIYRKGLTKFGVETINIPKDVVCSYYKFLCFLKNEKEKELMKSRLREKHSVEASNGIYWPMCHTQPLYKGSASYPKAEAKLARSMCIPLFSSMKKEDANYVLDCISKEIKK